MEFQYRGANCVQVVIKNATLLTDPKISLAGLKDPLLTKVDICLLSDPRFGLENPAQAFVVDCPGEYEIKGFSLKGIAARAHMAEEGTVHTSTIYRISTQDLNVAVLGHIYPVLSDEQLEAIGVVDVVIVPVGGSGYTLDAVGAAKLVRAISPKIVIPTHFADPAISYEVPQQELELFVKELGAPHEQADKLKLKRDGLVEALKVVELKRA